MTMKERPSLNVKILTDYYAGPVFAEQQGKREMWK